MGRVKWVKGVNYTVTDGKRTFGGEQAIVYINSEL